MAKVKASSVKLKSSFIRKPLRIKSKNKVMLPTNDDDNSSVKNDEAVGTNINSTGNAETVDVNSPIDVVQYVAPAPITVVNGLPSIKCPITGCTNVYSYETKNLTRKNYMRHLRLHKNRALKWEKSLKLATEKDDGISKLTVREQRKMESRKAKEKKIILYENLHCDAHDAEKAERKMKPVQKKLYDKKYNSEHPGRVKETWRLSYYKRIVKAKLEFAHLGDEAIKNESERLYVAKHGLILFRGTKLPG